MNRLLRILCALLCVTVFAGCATAGRSVRALQQYSREPASFSLAIQRLADLEATLATVRVLLTETPYTPGDTWVSELALDDASADALKAELAGDSRYTSSQQRVPVARVYLTHVQRVLATNAPNPTTAHYPSLMAALADMGADSASANLTRATALQEQIGAAEARLEALKAERRETDNEQAIAHLDQRIEAARGEVRTLDDQLDSLADTLEADSMSIVDAFDDPALRQVAEDLVTVLSVAVRMDAEAAAMVPVISQQLYRSFTPQELAQTIQSGLLYGVTGFPDVMGRLQGIGRELLAQYQLLGALTGGVVGGIGQKLKDTPGYVLRDTAVDAIAGFALDSFYFELDTGVEALFFNFASSTDEVEGVEGTTYDYSGRQFILVYDVEPIIVADFALAIGFDFQGIPDFFRFDLNYATDRVWTSGGSIERSNDVLGQLEAGGAFSDALQFALGIAGVKGDVRIASFNSGVVGVEDTATGAIVETAPLAFESLTIHVGYDILWLLQESPIRRYADQLTVGFRYLDYSLPRILYVLEDVNGDPDADDYEYVAESAPQDLNTRYYTGEVAVHRGVHVGGMPGLLYTLGLGFGGGPIRGDFEGLGYEPDALLGFTGRARLGYSANITRGDRFYLDFLAFYDAEFVLPFSGDLSTSTDGDDDSDLGTRTASFGGIDIFHGPTIRLKMGY